MVVVVWEVCRRCRRRTGGCPELPGGSKGSEGSHLPVLRLSEAGGTHVVVCRGPYALWTWPWAVMVVGVTVALQGYHGTVR